MTRILLIRHGESTWNAEGRLQGQLDPELSDEGRRQVEALTPHVRALRPARCISSDLARARQTAELLGYPDPELDPDWREIDLGGWSGKLVDEVAGVELDEWRGGLVQPPGGESRETFLNRVGSALDRIPATGDTILVVTHGGCVRMACAHVTGAEPDRFGPIPNASLSMITVLSRPRLTVLSWIPAPLSRRAVATDLASG